MQKFSDQLKLKRFIFLAVAVVLFSMGVTSLLAAPMKPQNPAPAAELASRSNVPSVIAKSSPFDHAAAQVSPETLIVILMRMGFFYAGFICVLLAFEVGIDKPTPKKAAKFS